MIMAQSQPSGWKSYQDRSVSQAAADAYAKAFELVKKQEQEIKSLKLQLSESQAKQAKLERENKKFRDHLIGQKQDPDKILKEQ
jgi:2-methylcitrate dehydratase PrpD